MIPFQTDVFDIHLKLLFGTSRVGSDSTRLVICSNGTMEYLQANIVAIHEADHMIYSRLLSDRNSLKSATFTRQSNQMIKSQKSQIETV
jgi:hypothetical protein